MLSVDEAVARVKAVFAPLESERVALSDAAHRVLAHDVIAPVDQPPYAVSAMDGYAVRLSDADAAGARLRVIGTAPAGHPFDSHVGAGEAVRIFTGSVVPQNANAILIQENAQAQDDAVVTTAPATPRHIRAAGLDFKKGAVLVPSGHRLTARDLSLIAAADCVSVDVYRKPRVAF